MRRWIVYAAVALLAILAVVAVVAPAQWMAALVRNLSQGTIELSAATGTFWSGRAIIVVGRSEAGVARASLAEPLAWRLSPWPLLAGVVDLTLSHPSALAQPLAIRATFAGHLDVGPAQIRLPASLLTGLGAPWNTIRPGGILVLTWDRLSIEQGRMRGNPSAEWQLASSALTPVSPFGHYRLQTSGEYPGLRLNLLTIAGPLELTGDGTIAAGGRLRFHGIARPQPSSSPAVRTRLAGLIALLGRREGDSAILDYGN